MDREIEDTDGTQDPDPKEDPNKEGKEMDKQECLHYDNFPLYSLNALFRISRSCAISAS